ncbi:exodeoxyribonuclease VII large subunit [Edaphobacter albus]|uniref:exodeoxyribonuclease VII large subunit n=1 Tax=Edaphobacter sp. 4G125 TaxID=2763071 RepID=UPI0016458352|nr:exodeoxyribonuclease VII large subunit [Edaphobacter sp. 4G125]QNI36344.1 exodeoxyribonuclease VII large subunit [Edaphobacter sp. 4G125]
MSAREPKTPTLASLRAGRRQGRSSRASEAAKDLQASLGFDSIDIVSIPETDVLAMEPKKFSPNTVVKHRIWTVAALVGSIRQQIETAYSDLWVEGEISNCRIAPSGHIYFTLKDGEAQLPVVLFRRQAQLLRFRPADGMAVLVRGRASVYESRGQLQLIAETLEPQGAGSLQLAFEQLKARLLAEGLFNASRKRSLPSFPRCVGIITSPTGAVVRDIVTVIRRRHARLNLLIYPAIMQGDSSPASVAAGIRWFNRNPGLVDLILIARGGGSMEDLACFNDEALARMIAESKLPVVSAIGHETDFTISDFVADLRAPTPSAAAELITTAQHRIEERIEALGYRAARAIRLHLLESRQRFARLSTPIVLRRAAESIDRREQRIDELSLRLDQAIVRSTRSRFEMLRGLEERLRREDITHHLVTSHRRVERAKDRLDRAMTDILSRFRIRLQAEELRLQALSPLSVLARGYALVYAENGALLRSTAETAPGQTIRARLGSGTLSARVTETGNTENSNS